MNNSGPAQMLTVTFLSSKIKSQWGLLSKAAAKRSNTLWVIGHACLSQWANWFLPA
jgi:hypothetical protein